MAGKPPGGADPDIPLVEAGFLMSRIGDRANRKLLVSSSWKFGNAVQTLETRSLFTPLQTLNTFSVGGLMMMMMMMMMFGLMSKLPRI